MKNIFSLLFLGVLALGLMSPVNQVWGQTKSLNEVKVGVVVPLTGSMASIGLACQRGTILAADRINKDGGIKALGGAKIKLIFADDEAKPDVAIAEGERLIKTEKVDALIGAYTSSCSFPLTQVAERNQIPILVPASAKDEITERGFKYTFRFCDKASGYSRTNLDFLNWVAKKTNTKIKNVGLLYEDSAWGQSYMRTLQDFLAKTDYKVIVDLPYNAQTKDIRSTILRLKAANPDAVFQVSYVTDAILVSRTMGELKFDTNGIITGGSGTTVPDFYQGVGNLSEYLFVTEPFSDVVPLGEIKARAKEYRERFNINMDMYGAFFYTCTYTLAQAIENARSLDKQEVRDALSKVNIKVGSKGNLFLYDSTFDAKGQAPANSLVCQWRNGIKEVVFPEQYATKEVVFPIPKWEVRK